MIIHKEAKSNNTIVFETKPSEEELTDIFDIILEGGGSEPAFYNGQTARERARWFNLTNPCGEILLSGAGSFFL